MSYTTIRSFRINETHPHTAPCEELSRSVIKALWFHSLERPPHGWWREEGFKWRGAGAVIVPFICSVMRPSPSLRWQALISQFLRLHSCHSLPAQICSISPRLKYFSWGAGCCCLVGVVVSVPDSRCCWLGASPEAGVLRTKPCIRLKLTKTSLCLKLGPRLHTPFLYPDWGNGVQEDQIWVTHG